LFTDHELRPCLGLRLLSGRQERVVYGTCRERRECSEQRRVSLIKRSTVDSVGRVEVAVAVCRRLDAHHEKPGHRGMVVGEPHSTRIAGDIGDEHRTCFRDRQCKEAVATWVRPDGLGSRALDAVVNEAADPSVLVHTERCIGRAHQRSRSPDDPGK
jgi:hypothetical protein